MATHPWWAKASVTIVAYCFFLMTSRHGLSKHGIYTIEVPLTRWGPVTHLCVSKLTIIISDNGLSPGRRQAIIWTNAGILLIETIRANFNEILIKIHTFSFKKIHLKTLFGIWVRVRVIIFQFSLVYICLWLLYLLIYLYIWIFYIIFLSPSLFLY